MTTATFFTKNKAPLQMYLSTLRRSLALAVFYALLLFAMFPMLSLLSFTNAKNYDINISFLHGWAGIYNSISIVAVPIICIAFSIIVGLYNFSYLHKKTATDVFHALPINRGSLFTSTYFAGLTVLWVPLILSFAFIFAIGDGSLNTLHVLTDLLGWLTVTGAVYSITGAVSVLCGSSFDSALFSILFCGIYPVIVVVIKSSIELLLLGCAGLVERLETSLSDLLSLSPFTLMVLRLFLNPRNVMMSYGDIERTFYSQIQSNIIAIFVWLAIAAALYFIARQFYMRRKSELAGRTITRSAVTSTAKYIFTLMCSGIFGILLGLAFNDKWLYLVGALIGGIIAYVGIEAIVARGFRTFPKAFLQMLAPVALVTAFGVILVTGGLGYAQYIPTAEEIETVSINYNGVYGERRLVALDKSDPYSFYYNNYGKPQEGTVNISSPEGIEAIRALHLATIAEFLPLRGQNNLLGDSSLYPQLIYTLKSGKTVTRYYNSVSTKTAQIITPLEDMEEFKLQTNPVFLLAPGDISGVIFSNLIGGDEEVWLDPDQREQLIYALSADFLAQKVSDIANRKYAEVGFISLVVRGNEGMDRTVLVPHYNKLLITEQHTNTLQFLRENALLPQLWADETSKNSTSKYNAAISVHGTGNTSVAYKSTATYNSSYRNVFNKELPNGVNDRWVNASEFVSQLLREGHVTAPIDSDVVLVYFGYYRNDESNGGACLYVERDKLPEKLLADLTAKELEIERKREQRRNGTAASAVAALQ